MRHSTWQANASIVHPINLFLLPLYSEIVPTVLQSYGTTLKNHITHVSKPNLSLYPHSFSALAVLTEPSTVLVLHTRTPKNGGVL